MTYYMVIFLMGLLASYYNHVMDACFVSNPESANALEG